MSEKPATLDLPVPEFDLIHLPQEYRETPVLEFIKAVSALTVRIRVNLVSWKRPKGYAFSENRGSRVPHVGFGLVMDVSLGEGPCPCPTCGRSERSSPTPQPWYKVRIDSACHVLYNSQEALATKVDFFYDSQKSRDEGRVKTISAHEVIEKNKKSDVCMFTCVTHDKGLCE